MKSITLSADESLIETVRGVAKSRKTTVNQLFREWLMELAGRCDREQALAELMGRLNYVKSGGPFTRDEMNER